MALPEFGDQNPTAAEFAAGLFTTAASLPELERQSWAAGIMRQAIMPQRDSMVRFARPLARSNGNFTGGMGVPIHIMPGMNGDNGTQFTYAVEGIRISEPNFNVQARRETMGSSVAFGSGQINIHYIDDMGVNVGTGIKQHDGLSRRDLAYRNLQDWHTSLMDEILRIPMAGRRGTGGGWYAFPETESGTIPNDPTDAQLMAGQPMAVKQMFRGKNALKAAKDGTVLRVGGGDSSDDISAADFLKAIDISRAEAAINTTSAARHEFPFPKIDTALARLAPAMGDGGSPVDYLMFASGEALQKMKTDDNKTNTFSFMDWHRQLAASNKPMSAVFWSNLMTNIGGIGIIKEPRKWPVWPSSSDAAITLQRSVIVGADCVRFAFGTEPWEDLTTKLGRGGMVSMGRDLVALGQMWKPFTSNDNGGLMQNYFCAAHLGAKQNWLKHPQTGEEHHHGWFAIEHSVESVRVDEQF